MEAIEVTTSARDWRTIRLFVFAAITGGVIVPLMVCYPAIVGWVAHALLPDSLDEWLSLRGSALGFLFWPAVWLQADSKHYMNGLWPATAAISNALLYLAIAAGATRWRHRALPYWTLFAGVASGQLFLTSPCISAFAWTMDVGIGRANWLRCATAVASIDYLIAVTILLGYFFFGSRSNSHARVGDRP
jgi:hypothetical protein